MIYLKTRIYGQFTEELNTNIKTIKGNEKQQLLTDIIDYYYDKKQHSFIKKAFDLIIDSKLNLNFNIDHWAPTFLSLVVIGAPHIELFEYFIKKEPTLTLLETPGHFILRKTRKQKKNLRCSNNIKRVWTLTHKFKTF